MSIMAYKLFSSKDFDECQPSDLEANVGPMLLLLIILFLGRASTP